MSAIFKANTLTYKAGGAIPKGAAVKVSGSDGKTVVVCTAKTDKSIGIAQGAASLAGDLIEVAIPGGGAKAKLGGTVAAGDLLAPTTDGSLIVTTTANDRYIGMALEDGVSGDIIATNCVAGNY